MHLMAAHDSATQQRPLDGLIAAGVGLLACSTVILRLLIGDDDETLIVALLAQGAIYAVAVWLVVRRPWGRGALAVIVGCAILARALALLSPALLSTDIYRYVWDGRVQAAGINPYRYLPIDERLAPLRDEAIYQSIERKDYAPTIYPPVAQMIFLVVSRASETVTAMKVAMLGFDLVTIAAIVALLGIDGLPRERVLIYAWHPLPIWEFSGTGHVDAAAIAFMCLAMLMVGRGRSVFAGALLAAATLVKPFPLAVAPALWRPWDWRIPAGFGVAAALSYLPHLGAGWQVFGYLGGYVDEEHYRDGYGFFAVALLRELGLPSPSGPVYMAVAFAIFAALAIAVAFRARPSAIDPATPIWLGASFLFLTTPHYPWYFAWVLPLLCRRVYVPLVYPTIACFILYITEIDGLAEKFKPVLWLFSGFVVLVVIDLAVRVRGMPIRRPA